MVAASGSQTKACTKVSILRGQRERERERKRLQCAVKVERILGSERASRTYVQPLIQPSGFYARRAHIIPGSENFALILLNYAGAMEPFSGHHCWLHGTSVIFVISRLANGGSRDLHILCVYTYA